MEIAKNINSNNSLNLERGEVILSPNGKLSKIMGKLHSQGGENVFVEQGSKMFSSKIKLPASIVKAITGKAEKKSPADLVKKYDYSKFTDTIENSKDEYRVNTANLMRDKYKGQVDTIFQAQEDFKKSRGVKDGMLLSEQGLNADLEPTNKSYETKEEVYQTGSDYNPTFTIPNLLPRNKSSEYSPMLKVGKFNTPNTMGVNELSLLSRINNPKSSLLKPLYSTIAVPSNDRFKEGSDQGIGVGSKDYYGVRDTNLQTPTSRDYSRVISPIYSDESMINPVFDGNNKVYYNPNEGKAYHEYSDNGDIKREIKDIDYSINRSNSSNSNLVTDTNSNSDNSNSDKDDSNQDMELQVPKELEKAKLLEFGKYLTRKKLIPYLNQNEQAIAYNRVTPVNTMQVERAMNMNDMSMQNSGQSSQVQDAVRANSFGKFVEGISDTQLKNYQIDLENDNKNNQNLVNTYNYNKNAANQNMAQYVKENQVVEDQYDKEGEKMINNIQNYSYQQAKINDNFTEARMEGVLLNKPMITKTLFKKNGKYYTGTEKNKSYELPVNPSSNMLNTNSQNKLMERAMQLLNSDDEKKIGIGGALIKAMKG